MKDRGKILTPEERARLTELVDLLDDLNVTWIDREESEELYGLIRKLNA